MCFWMEWANAFICLVEHALHPFHHPSLDNSTSLAGIGETTDIQQSQHILDKVGMKISKLEETMCGVMALECSRSFLQS